MSKQRYERYKDSGFEWLGEVPAHWRVSRFKEVIEQNDGGVWGEDPEGSSADTLVLRSTEQTVDGRWAIDEPALRKLSHGDREAALLQEGDLVITKSSGSALHIGKTSIVDKKIEEMGCCYSNFNQRVRLSLEFEPKLAWYILNNRVSRLQLAYLSNSTTGLANLNSMMIGSLLLAHPPKAEQGDIIAFLDRETAKIDALVEEQERLIARLAEKRQAVISHAVTRGLDPTVEMKDSGVEWLGDVPAHWEAMRLKHVSPCITVGIVIEPSKYYVDEGVPALRSLNIRPGTIVLDNLVFISDEANRDLSKSRLCLGDIVVVRTGQPGTAAVVDDKANGCNCIDLVIIRRPIEALSEFLCWVLNSEIVQVQIKGGSEGAIQQHFNIGTAANLVVPLPPIADQRKIADYLALRVGELDNLCAAARQAISLLHERRTALISAAVTGKIDVREHATVPA